MRGLAIEEARQEARRELSAAFDRVEKLWTSVQRVSVVFAGLAARLSPQDRQELDAARAEMQRAAGAKAGTARDVGSATRGEER